MDTEPIYALAERMLDQALNPDPEKHASLLAAVLDQPRWWVVAEEGTTEESWKSRAFLPLRSPAGALLLFLSPGEAEGFARQNGLLLEDRPMIAEKGMEELSEMIRACRNRDGLRTVRVYSIPPMRLDLAPDEFPGVAPSAPVPESLEPSAPDIPEPDPDPDLVPPEEQPPLMPPADHLLGVEEIRAALNTMDAAARKKLDPPLFCENAHRTIQSILSRNRLDPSVLDRELKLPAGFTARFCQDLTGSDTSKEILLRLLERVGLREYLYVYKEASREVMRELRDNPGVDLYTLRPERVTTKEHFLLKQITRGRDSANGAFLYRLQLESKARAVEIVLSNPKGCIPGKGYQIVGLEPVIDETKTESAMKSARTLTDREKAELLEGLKPVEKRKKNPPLSPEELQAQKDTVIGYVRRSEGISSEEAEKKFAFLAEDPDVLKAFTTWVRTGRWGFLARRGYTPRKLTEDLGFPPFESYAILLRLQTAEAPDTLRMLKDREADPQYRKPESKKPARNQAPDV